MWPGVGFQLNMIDEETLLIPSAGRVLLVNVRRKRGAPARRARGMIRQNDKYIFALYLFRRGVHFSSGLVHLASARPWRVSADAPSRNAERVKKI